MFFFGGGGRFFRFSDFLIVFEVFFIIFFLWIYGFFFIIFFLDFYWIFVGFSDLLDYFGFLVFWTKTTY